MRPPRLRPLPALVSCLGLLASAVVGAEWPHWRGPNRNDVTAETSGYQQGQWPPRQPAWRISVGVGSSSPVVAGGRMYTLGWQDGGDVVRCTDAATGKEVWRQNYRCPPYGRLAEGDQNQYRGPSSTPEYDTETGYLYTLGADGDLNCWDTKEKGKKVWGFNLHDRYGLLKRPQVPGSGQRDYGCTSSPLVHGDWLVVEIGAKEGTVAAFDRRTGKQAWLSEFKGPAGHSGGPVPMTVEGVPCLAVLTHAGLLVVRLDGGSAGKTVATYDWVTQFSNNIATPAVHDNYVLITSAYNHRAMCKLEITLQGARRVWEKRFASGVCSPVIHEGHVYWAWNQIRCLDFATGEEKWAGGRIGSPGSCIVTGDDRLIVWGNSGGDLLLVETAARSPGRLTVLAQSNDLLGNLAWPHVVLAGGRLFCKDRDGNVLCFELGAG